MPQPTPKVHVERSRPNIAEMNKHNTDTEGREQKKTDEPYVEFNTNRPEDEDGTRLVYQDLTTILQIGGEYSLFILYFLQTTGYIHI
uniref:Uncharacterized protein n=1 Tax=Rhodnius prolixus TaxID=13249 RepID=T1I9T0_RHOPR